MRLTRYYKKNLLKPLLFVAFIMLLCVYGFGQPVANFSSNIVSGCAPLTVNFQDLSTKNPTSWQWDLGNGTISNQQAPTTTYFNPGSYTVSLTVSNAAGNNSITKINYITVYDKPVVNFSASDLTGCFPATITFTDLSTSGSGSISKWDWDFGNGDTSALQNPSENYISAGNYSITLKATNSNGCTSVLTKPQYIKIPNGVDANFSNSYALHCKPPETINFNNLSTGPPALSYQWDFGDGNTSTAQNPSNIYLNGGTYSVQLIVKSTAGCVDTLIKQDSIVIRNYQTDFSGPDSICKGSTADFSNISAPVNTNSFWDFGDGTTSTLNNPTKSWNTYATYQVKLVNNFGVCIDSVIKLVKITLASIANFTVADTFNCKAPFTTQFTDLTPGSVSWSWNFGDGSTSTMQNLSHTYSTIGQFNVTLTITNGAGCSSTITKAQYVKIITPIVTIDSVPIGGCIPFSFTPTSTINDPKGIANYLWDFGDGNTSTVKNPTNIYSFVGTYTVKLSVTTNDGCTASTITPAGVKTGTPPISDFSATPLMQCVGLNIQFTDMSTSADGWLWDFGDGGSATTQNPAHAYQTSSTFSVKLFATSNGCPSTIPKTITVQTLPPVAKFTPVFNCVNKLQVTFTDNSSAPLAWSWDFGDGSTSNIQNPTHTYASLGNYNVKLTVTNGSCTNSKTIPIKLVDEHPEFIFSKDSVCKATLVQIITTNIDTANIATYIYDYGDGDVVGFNGNIAGHFYLNSGIYYVKVTTTDIHGCNATTPPENPIYVHGPTANFNASSLAGCQPLNVIFTDNSTTDGINVIKKWQWDYGDGVTQNLTGPPFSHIYNTLGNFIVKLTVTDSSGCISSDTLKTPIQITHPTANFTSSDTAACIGENVIFNNTSTGINLTYTWSLGNRIISNQQNPITTYSIDSSYTVKLITTDVNGCKDSLQKNSYIKLKTATAGFTINDSVSFCLPFEVDFTNTSVNNTSQLWDFGDSSTSTAKNPVHYYSTPGIYTATLFAISQGGCLDSLKRTIKLLSLNAVLTYNPLHGCSPDIVNFHLSTAGGLANYFWDFGDGNTTSSTDSNITNNYLTPGNYLPKVILTDSSGCQIPITGTDTIHLTESFVNFSTTDSATCIGVITTFADSTSGDATITSWQWDFGDSSFSTLQNPTHLYKATGIYSVKLIVHTSDGCSDSLIKNNYIHIYGPIAKFGASKLTGCQPLNEIFADSSITDGTNPISIWQWDYGDGNIQTLNNPPFNHVYDSAGNFFPRLKITDAFGCSDSFNLATPIFVSHPKAGFNSADTLTCIGSNVSFNNTSSGINLTYAWDLGNGNTSTQISPVASYLADDSYSIDLIVTDSIGCMDSLLLNNYIKVQTVKASFTVNDSASICPPLNIIFTNTSVNDSSLTWNFGDGTSSNAINPTHSYNIAGTYIATLIATGRGGCMDSAKQTIHLYTSGGTLTYSPVSGCSQVNTSFHISVTGPVTYFWDFSDGDTVSSVLPDISHNYTIPGSYVPKVIIKDPTGCNIPVIGSDTIHVTKSLINFTTIDSALCHGDTTIFSDKTNSNSTINSWQWNFGDGSSSTLQNPVHFYNNTGNYSVQLIINTIDGCSDSLTKNNYVHIYGPTAKFSALPVAGCQPLNENFTDNSTTDGIHAISNWQWNYGDGTVQTLSSPPFNHLYNTSGNFFTRLKITDSFGCSDSFSLSAPIIVDHPKAAFSSANTLACTGSNVLFNNTSTGINLTYAWSFGNGVSSNQQNPTTSYATNGNYSVKLVITDSIGCMDSLLLNNYITVQTAKAAFTVNDSATSCPPLNVIFTNNSVNDSSFSWDFGDGTTSNAINPTHSYASAGNFIATLTIIGQGGCVDSVQQGIHVYPSGGTLTYSPVSGCSQVNTSFHISASGPVTYFWDFGDGDTVSYTLPDISHNYTIPGSYIPKVTIKDITGCQVTVNGTDTIHLDKSIENFTSAKTAVCLGDSISFTDLSSSNSIITSRQWAFGDGVFSTLQNPSHLYNAAGTYSVLLIIKTIDGCIDSLTKNNYISIAPVPSVAIQGDTSSCIPGNLSFTGNLLQPDTFAITWQWQFGNGNTSSLQNPPAQAYNSAGNFPLQLIAASNGCADTVNKTVVIHPLPIINAGKDTSVCMNTAFQLQASGADTYTWSPPDYLSCTNCANPLSDPADNIKYIVQGKTTFGCQATDSVFITVHKKITVTVTPTSDSLCIGQAVKLNANGAANYTWMPSTGLSNTQVSNPIASPDSTITYKVVGADGVHCFKDTALVTIDVFNNPTVKADPDINIADGATTVLAPQYSSDINAWMWNPPDNLSCTNCPNPTASPKFSTSYTITVSNPEGCTAMDSITIILPCSNAVFIPNTFSPNNDKSNDIFYPRGKDLYKIQSMRIFDRWGELVFQRSNFSPNDPSQGWDGTINGQKADIGVYVYVIEIICDNSTISTFKGNVSLIR
jgi:gliding motility-associated-like protein